MPDHGKHTDMVQEHKMAVMVSHKLSFYILQTSTCLLHTERPLLQGQSPKIKTALCHSRDTLHYTVEPVLKDHHICHKR